MDAEESNTGFKLTERLQRKLNESSQKTSKSTKGNIVPNYNIRINALKFLSLPGPSHEKELNEINDLLQKYKNDSRIIILNASRTMKFKGIYIQNDESAEKIYGKWPDFVDPSSIKMFYKYVDIHFKSITQTTEAFSLVKSLEPQSW